MDKVILVYQWGDYGVPVVIGVATDKEAGKKLLKNRNSEIYGTKQLEELPGDKFREKGCEPGEYTYWFEEEKLNHSF